MLSGLQTWHLIRNRHSEGAALVATACLTAVRKNLQLGVGAIAEGTIGAMLAATKSDFLFCFDLDDLRSELGADMRAVAIRLILAFTTGTPGISFYFSID